MIQYERPTTQKRTRPFQETRAGGKNGERLKAGKVVKE